jgi:hypothetical protein
MQVLFSEAQIEVETEEQSSKSFVGLILILTFIWFSFGGDLRILD